MEHTKSLKRHLNIFQLAQEHKKISGAMQLRYRLLDFPDQQNLMS